MATPINYREVFGSQNLENLASGSYNYISRRGREQEVKVIPAKAGTKSIQYCGASKVNPRLGMEGMASMMFIMGHKVLEANNLQLPVASSVVFSVFSGLTAEEKENKTYAQVEGTLVGTLVAQLAQLALDSKFSRALREQYAGQILAKGFDEGDEDKDLDEDLRDRLRGDAKARAARKAKDATRPFVYVFAEIFCEMELEWKVRVHRHGEDMKKNAVAEFNRQEEANRRKTVGGLLAGLGVASMDKDGGGRKTTTIEPTLSAEETAQLGNLLGAKPARNRAGGKRTAVTDVA